MSQKFFSDITLSTLSSGILKVDADGKVVKAVAGTDYLDTATIGSLDGLSDVVVTSPTADQILVYGQPLGGDPGVNVWYNKTPSFLTGASSINALGDVTIGTTPIGQLLSWNGSAWVNWSPNFLTSYTETDPIYTASSWYTTTNNSSNWDTAYGWGNHAGLYSLTSHTHNVFTQATSEVGGGGEEVIIPGSNGFVPASGFEDGSKFLRGDGTWQTVTTDLTGYATEAWVGQQGYLTSYTETDPVFVQSAAYNVRAEDITAWSAAYEWGDHSEAGYLTTFTETDPVYTASSWYTTTNNSTNWNTAYGWGNHAGLYVAKTFSYTAGSHSYAWPNPEAWYKIAKVVLNGNCQSFNIWGEYRDLSYYLNTNYQIHITARAECDFLSNNESHTLRVNIFTLSTNKTGFLDKVRVVLTKSEDGIREYELQYYRTTWDTGMWELQSNGFTLYETSQTAGEEIPSEHVVYSSILTASKLYAENLYVAGDAVATQVWVGAQGYLTSYTETDPIYTGSSWYTTTNNATDWDTAYGWGDHGEEGYLTSYENNYISDVRVVDTSLVFTGEGNAYNQSVDLSALPFQAQGNYLTAESDTLATVVSRGSLTYNAISVAETTGGGYLYRTNSGWGGWARNGFSFADGSGTVMKALGAYGNAGTEVDYMYLGSDYLNNNLRIYSGYVYVPGLDLAISNINGDHGKGTYFRGDSSHFVLGLNNGNTFYFNYGNPSGAILSYGTLTHSGSLNVIDGGNVGIGTQGPISRLDIRGAHTGGYGIVNIVSTDSAFISIDSQASDGGLRLKYNTADKWLLGIRGGDIFHISNASDQYKLSIRQDGNVGIGVTSPVQKLDVDGNISLGSWTRPGSAYVGLRRADDGSFGGGGDSGLVIESYNHDGAYEGDYSQRVHLRTHLYNGGSHNVLTAYGYNVGIGTSSPNYSLDVQTAAGNAIIGLTSPSNSGAFTFWTNGSGNSEAYVGVNNSAATLVGGIGGAYGTFFASYNARPIGFGVDGSEKVRITSAGNVGIGTTSPTSPLDVLGRSQ